MLTDNWGSTPTVKMENMAPTRTVQSNDYQGIVII